MEIETPAGKPSSNQLPPQRPVDELTEETYSWFKKKWILIRKTEIRTWQGVFILAFFTGLAVAVIFVVSLDKQSKSGAVGGSASLSMTPGQVSTTEGASFSVDVMMNTNGNNVVVAKADITYAKADLQLVSYSTASSAFSSGNACIYNNKPCEIIENDPANGKISITLAKPTPGVNTASGKIATLTFSALQPANSSLISIQYSGAGNYDDSDIILDDGQGTDILNSVSSGSVAISDSLVPINGVCGSSGNQVLSSAPSFNLCSTGAASSVSGTGPWSWTCGGINSGSAASCAAFAPGSEISNTNAESIADSYVPYLILRSVPISADSQSVLPYNKNAVRFQGLKADAANGSIRIYKNNKVVKKVAIDANGNWSASVSGKANKAVSFKFAYYDSVGQPVFTAGTYRVKVDLKKPKVIAPRKNALTVSVGGTISAKAKDNIRVSRYIFSFNGQTQESDSKSFIIPEDTAAGTYTLSIRAKDAAGNTSAAKKVKITVR